MWNPTKGKYYLVPDDSRPSQESIADHQPLIRPSIHAGPCENARLQRSTRKATTLRIESSASITFLFRLLAFIFHLTGVIVLSCARQNRAVPSQVFLSFALARNLYVLLSHLLSKCIRIRINLRMDNMSKLELPAWAIEKAIPLLIDGVIFVILMIVLPLGLKSVHGYYNSSNTLKNGFIVSFVGLPFYFLGAMDCGKPKSLTFGASVELSLIGGKTRRDSMPGTPEMVCRDIEAQLPTVAAQVDQKFQQPSLNLL